MAPSVFMNHQSLVSLLATHDTPSASYPELHETPVHVEGELQAVHVPFATVIFEQSKTHAAPEALYPELHETLVHVEGELQAVHVPFAMVIFEQSATQVEPLLIYPLLHLNVWPLHVALEGQPVHSPSFTY